MAEIRSFGLASIRLAAVPADGTMALDADLQALGVTLQDTAQLVTDDPQEDNVFSEENVVPEETFFTQGFTNLRFSIINIDPEQAVKILGGTVTGVAPATTYNAPTTQPSIEQSVEVLTKSGLKIQIPRGKVTAKVNFQFRKRGVLQIDVNVRVLQPAGAGVFPYSWSQS